MAQFFFNFRDGKHFEPDDVGLELPDLNAAYLEAFETAKEMWIEAIRSMRDPRRQQFEISDAQGNTLLIVPFKEVMDSLKGVPKAAPMTEAERAARLSSELAESIVIARTRLDESRALLARLRRVGAPSPTD